MLISMQPKPSSYFQWKKLLKVKFLATLATSDWHRLDERLRPGAKAG